MLLSDQDRGAELKLSLKAVIVPHLFIRDISAQVNGRVRTDRKESRKWFWLMTHSHSHQSGRRERSAAPTAALDSGSDQRDKEGLIELCTSTGSRALGFKVIWTNQTPVSIHPFLTHKPALPGQTSKLAILMSASRSGKGMPVNPNAVIKLSYPSGGSAAYTK